MGNILYDYLQSDQVNVYDQSFDYFEILSADQD